MISAADPTALLSTIAQSSAAIVAIVGGFLVSRLVALSSEREGIRRQLTASQDRLDHVRVDYSDAPSAHVEHSVSQFTEWVLPDLVDPPDDFSTESLHRDNVPRGSRAMDDMHDVGIATSRVQVDSLEELGAGHGLLTDTLLAGDVGAARSLGGCRPS